MNTDNTPKPIFVARFPLTNQVTKKELGMWKIDETESFRTYVRTGTLEDLLKVRSSAGCCAIQRFNAKHRVAKGSEEYYFTFNHCIFIDIDYCKCKVQPVEPNSLREILLEELKKTPGFLYMENSMHRDENKQLSNFHLIFYVLGCDVTYYEYFHNKFTEVVKKILARYKINFKECLDENVANPCHLMFLTGLNAYLNDDFKEYKVDVNEFFGWIQQMKEKQSRIESVETQQADPNDYFIGQHTKFPNQHLGYTQRWYLFSNLCKIYTGDELKENWERICSHFVPGKHSIEYYKQEPFAHDWVLSSRNVQKVNNNLLARWGVVYRKNKNALKILRKLYG